LIICKFFHLVLKESLALKLINVTCLIPLPITLIPGQLHISAITVSVCGAVSTINKTCLCWHWSSAQGSLSWDVPKFSSTDSDVLLTFYPRLMPPHVYLRISSFPSCFLSHTIHRASDLLYSLRFNLLVTLSQHSNMHAIKIGDSNRSK
jgi:hypothetical protein